MRQRDDEASCAVFGMPRAAIDIGAAQHVVRPSDLARGLLAVHTARTPRSGH